MTILIFLIVSYILLSISLYFLFPKAGEEGWKGLVPGLNFVVMCKIIGRKPSYAALLLIPIVNIFIYVGMCVDVVRSFKKYQLWHSAIAVIYAPIAFFYLAFNKDEKYDEPTVPKERAYAQQLEAARKSKNERQLKKLAVNNPYKKSAAREWVEAVVFAVFAAAFIRMFLIEAYVIPTSSMEGSLLVGDFLFVSKASYGIRPPQTVMMVPLLHNRIPGINRESYLEKPKLPYYRFPALRELKRNDAVVFNYPEGDSVYVFPERTWSVHDFRRGQVAQASPLRASQISQGQAPLVTRPMDKKDHYIKRCIGLPGDTLQIINREVIINGEKAENPEKVQFLYHVQSPNASLNTTNFRSWGISDEDRFRQDNESNSQLIFLNAEQAEKIKAMDPAIKLGATKEYIVNAPRDYSPTRFTEYGIDNMNFRGNDARGNYHFWLTDEQFQQIRTDTNLVVKKDNSSEGRLFPHDPANYPGWTVDDYGPIYIPQKGTTIKIGPKNIAFYRRIIGVYEGNELRETDGKIYINGEATDSYTFQMNYYWMMGDNRHNSEDARVWGFVPENHIVGKPLIIWFSTREGEISKGINWSRLFKIVTNI